MESSEQQKLEDAMRLRYPLLTAWREFCGAVKAYYDFKNSVEAIQAMQPISKDELATVNADLLKMAEVDEV